MRVVSQLERYNKNATLKAVSEARRRHDKPIKAVEEAAVIAGEMIARLNSDHKTTVEEVIKVYKPDYLKKRGVV